MKYFFVFLMCIIVFSGAFAQKESRIVIKEISFSGNQKSKISYLESELMIAVDSSYSIAHIDQQVNRLSQISGLYEASYQKDSLYQHGKLSIHIKEQRTLLPVFNFGVQDQYYWFQLGLVDINLRGKGNTLYTYYQNSLGRHSAQLYFLKNTRTNNRFGYHFNLLKWSTVEPLYFFSERIFYDYDIYLFQPGVLYRWKPTITIELSQGIFVEHYERSSEEKYPFEIPDSITLTKSLSKLRVSQTRIEYNETRLDGWKWAAQYQGVLTLETSEYFHIAEFEGSYYRSLNAHVNAAVRVVGGVASNYDTPFAPFVIDSYRNIRGVGDRVQRGTALVTANYEVRGVLFNLPKWQLQSVVFSDIGWIRESGEQFRSGTLHAFAGIGCRVIYKPIYNASLRIDYARSLRNFEKEHFVIGLGQYF